MLVSLPGSPGQPGEYLAVRAACEAYFPLTTTAHGHHSSTGGEYEGIDRRSVDEVAAPAHLFEEVRGGRLGGANAASQVYSLLPLIDPDSCDHHPAHGALTESASNCVDRSTTWPPMRWPRCMRRRHARQKLLITYVCRWECCARCSNRCEHAPQQKPGLGRCHAVGAEYRRCRRP
jgi:hypothetical protein